MRLTRFTTKQKTKYKIKPADRNFLWTKHLQNDYKNTGGHTPQLHRDCTKYRKYKTVITHKKLLWKTIKENFSSCDSWQVLWKTLRNKTKHWIYTSSNGICRFHVLLCSFSPKCGKTTSITSKGNSHSIAVVRTRPLQILHAI